MVQTLLCGFCNILHALWTFEGGRVVAYDPAGVNLGAWLADEAMGPCLPDMLNMSRDLSQALLPRFFPSRAVTGCQSYRAPVDLLSISSQFM